MNIEALEKLQKLKEQGIITEAEFKEQKNKILNSDQRGKDSYQPISGCAVTLLFLVIVSILFGKFILLFLFAFLSN